MECSCKVWCNPCRPRLIPKQHSRHSWRLRKELMYGGLYCCVPGLRTELLTLHERRKTKKFVMGLKPSLRMRLVAFDHRTLDEALSAACRQEGEMEQYLEEKKASQKRPAATFQRQDKKKTVYQTPQRTVAVGSSQMLEVREQRQQDQRLPKTSTESSAWSASLSSSGSRASYRKTRKASSPSSCIDVNPIAVDEVSASTPRMLTLIPASNDVDANFSDLHALQSQKFRKQGNSPIGELSPTV
ncbi:hypothetical protein Taro_052179 [Colocasia esculenta]|uniref:Uncharacterized protein n=1 Tax=Colocasia esculenta TaxID=4460 RepID=A0A843XHX7_COLES|nr:hypothetical protein [Colocasia esculenta]